MAVANRDCSNPDVATVVEGSGSVTVTVFGPDPYRPVASAPYR